MTRGNTDAAERLEEAEEEIHDLQQQRSRAGTVARELELRALAGQHRAAYAQLIDNLEEAVRRAGREGWPSGQRFLMTVCQADIHMLGVASSPAADGYVRSYVRNPIYVQRLLQAGFLGAQERAHFLEYVEFNFLRPGLAALWKQLGGADQEPLGL